uniref:dihydrofolate reductase n=1 Tax=Myoviridae sp. ctPuP5 TaxID=2823543 RepID=A0A8S5L986_9CAUD|nr:MAG TPA: DHFR protein [Myoviridae sp. ctPuP5]
MTVNLIVAISENNAIGKNGDLCFHIKDDLKRFKELTIGKPVIMGYNTYKSLPNGALPKRENIVLCNDKTTVSIKENITLLPSLEEAIEYCDNNCYNDIFIIGGGMLYKYAIEHDLVDILYITKIHETVEDADTFFPTIDYNKWNEKAKEDKETEDGIKYSFVKYKRNKAKFKLNPDSIHVDKIHKAIEKKKEKFGKGYCPCVTKLAHCEDTICPCKEYRTNGGKCHCELYIE